MHKVGFARVLVLSGLVAGAATCKGNREVGLNIEVPRDLVESTVWFEVGAFRDATCDAITPMLSDGVPEGFTTRVAFRKDERETPTFGEIPNGKYAFAAVARGEDCTVLAQGCTEQDVGDVDTVSISMTTTVDADSENGKCPTGATCQAAKCVPANDNSDPSIGAGCSLELIGAGPLANPVGGQGTIVSAPAIAATPTGFIVAYREVDPNGAGARITLLPLDLGGGALNTLRPALPNPCANSDETDGVGLTVKGESAMLALAKAPCGAKPELQLLNFKTTPELGKFLVSPSPTGVRVSLGAARPAALRPNGGIVVFSEGGTARIATMDPEKGIVGPNGTFGGDVGITDAWVAATDKVLALLAAGPALNGPVQPVGDGGADSGGGSSSSSSSSGGGGGDEPPPERTLRLLMLPVSTPVEGINATTNSPRAPITFVGEFASIAAVGGRVIVVSDGTGPGRSVTYRAFDLGKDDAQDTSGFSVEGSGKVTSADVTILGDRAFFAALKPGAVALHVYANATTTLTPLRNVLFSRETRISAINTVRDGRVSVAATDSRVAVAWTTAKVLGPNDGTGGYAVFGCTQ